MQRNHAARTASRLPRRAWRLALIGTLWLSALQWAGAATLQDPRAPVRIDAPEGWKLSHANGVSSLQGDGGAFVSWLRVPGAGAEPSRARAAVDQMLGQLRNAQVRGQGPARFGGQAGTYVVANGLSPQGLEVSVRYLWAGFGDDAWLMVQSMPVAQTQTLLPLMDRVASSFLVASAAPAAAPLAQAAPGGPGAAGGPAAQAPRTAQVAELAVNPAPLEAMLREASRGVAQRLGQGVRWQGAFGDRQGQFMEAFFGFDAGGQPARGALLVLAGVSTAWMVVDNAAAFPRSHSAFMRQVSEALGRGAERNPAAAPRKLPLQTVNFGSGTIGLPQGWRVTGAFQGCVEAQAPVGYIALGCAEFAAVPGAYPDPRVFHHPYTDPATMFKGWLASANSHMGARDIQVLESTPSPSSVPGGQAAYVLADFVHTSSGRPVPYRGLALVHIMPTDRQTFTLYKSMVLIQRDQFEALMPTMWQSWKSWSVNPQVFRDRMDAALASMRETSRIITSGYAERSRASENVNRAFSQYIRGTATVEDVLSRQRAEGDAGAADRIVAADPARYRIVPLPELTPR